MVPLIGTAWLAGWPLVGWTLFAVIWSLAITGVVLKVIFKNRFKLARVGIYVAMGWLITFASSDLVANLSETALNLTIAGGILYTAGVAFYLADRIPYMHAIWHLPPSGPSRNDRPWTQPPPRHQTFDRS